MKRSPDSTAQMLALEALRSGTIASLAMMPFGLLFKSMGLRVGHYGPKVGEALFGHQPDPWMPVLLLVQHFVIGWLSARFCRISQSRTKFGRILQARVGPGRTYAASA